MTGVVNALGLPNHVQVLPCNLNLIWETEMLTAIYLILLSIVFGKVARVLDIDSIASGDDVSQTTYPPYGVSILLLIGSVYFAWNS